MAVTVQQPQKKENENAKWGSLIGMGVGAYYGGGAGAALGSQIGGAAGAATEDNSQSSSIASSESTPLMRRQDALRNDPTSRMREGKVALASMDAETQKAWAPVLDEGLRRAAQQRKENYGYGYSGPTAQA